MRRFLSHLAVERKVAAATQNQALNAILFLYRHVLGIDTGEAIDAVRAKKRRRLPVVLSPNEVQRVFGAMAGTTRLMGGEPGSDQPNPLNLNQKPSKKGRLRPL